jgi:hypothetical protein
MKALRGMRAYSSRQNHDPPEVQKQVGVRAKQPHVVPAAAVIGAVVVDERPAVAETKRLERAVNIGRPVGGIERPGVLHRVTHISPVSSM